MRLILVGDVMLGRLVNEVLVEKPPEYPWGDTLPIFGQADWRACNLECVIADSGHPWQPFEKAFHFRSDAKNVRVLEAARINAVSIANNHALDYSEPALFEMLNILDRSGIAYSGAGANLEQASRLAITQVGNQRIGFLALTDNEPDWEASDKRPGVYYMPIEAKDPKARELFGKVKEYRTQVDVLIVSLHWGPNWGYQPPSGHEEFAHQLIDSGADVIFGHSAHVFRGIELYRKRPILYSTGDFIDDYAVDPAERNDQSFIFMIEFERNKIVRLRLVPTVIREFQAQLAKGHEADKIALKMRDLCASFRTPIHWQKSEHLLEIKV